jgi:hypothetical protein
MVSRGRAIVVRVKQLVVARDPGAEEVSVKVGNRVQELSPYGPGGLIGTFLVDFLDGSLALATEMLAMTNLRG